MEALDNANDVETGIIRSKLRQSYVFRFCRRLCSPIFVQSFTMTFLAEWGDRSQLTTIILGSREVKIFLFQRISIQNIHKPSNCSVEKC